MGTSEVEMPRIPNKMGKWTVKTVRFLSDGNTLSWKPDWRPCTLYLSLCPWMVEATARRLSEQPTK